MVRLNRIYTKVGDRGDTCLIGGGTVRKNDPKVVAYGDVDELNCKLGEALFWNAAEAAWLHDQIFWIQQRLFDVGAELAAPQTAEWAGLRVIGEEETATLEQWLDALNEQLPPLESFVLPGGTYRAALLHSARAICRRAERQIVALSDKEPVRPELLAFMNRLSDLLFVFAREECRRAGAAEPLWAPKARPPKSS